MNKDAFAIRLNSQGTGNALFADVSGGSVTINNYGRDLSNGTFEEAVAFYIDEIKTSSLPIIEKALLIEEAPRRIRRFKNKRAVCDMAYDKLSIPTILAERLVKIDADTVNLILDEAEKVSDKEVQELWANILKRAVEDSGVSKRLINILSKLSKYEAITFDELCKYLVIFRTVEMSEDITHYPLATGFFLGNGNNYGYRVSKFERGDISRLVNAGLVQIQNANYEYEVKGKRLCVDYLHQRIYMRYINSGWLRCGHFRLTFEGEELYNCTQRTAWDSDTEYYHFIFEELEKQGKIECEQECTVSKILTYPVVY